MVDGFDKGKASVIVVNFNGEALLEECLDSLLGQTYRKCEIILVDNASSDGSCRLVEEKYAGRVRLIKNSANAGFAGGNNVGMREAMGEYLILVNNDTKSDRELVERLVGAAASDERVGMCAAKVVSYFNPGIIDGAGPLIYMDGLNQGRGRFEFDRGQYENIEEIIYTPGCGALYKKRMLDETGLFDEDFFAYGEDTDLGLRGRLFGWKALYVPKAVVYHKISKTKGEYSTFKLFFAERNRLFVTVKNFPAPLLAKSVFYTLLRYYFQFLSLIEGRGAARHYVKKASLGRVLMTVAAAQVSFLAHLPRTLRKRAALRRAKKISDAEFEGLFDRFGISARALVYRD